MIESIKPGWIIGIGLKKDAAPLRAYVGTVESVDELGIRIASVDWLTGGFHGYDFWFPWDQVTSMQVATDRHDKDSPSARDSFSKFQSGMTEKDQAT